jgi:hypothetical protein
LKYTVNIANSGTYNIQINVSAPATGGKIILSIDGSTIGNILDVPATGGWQNWQDININNIWLPQGKHTLQTRFFFGDFNFSYINFDLVAVGVEGENKNIPNEFSLNQNYPNPFNPNTVISYQLPVSNHVTLIVYDVLGNEIATIVDEYKVAGNYKVDFNPSTFNHQTSSGIYFYQLKAGDFIQTKKMILLK